MRRDGTYRSIVVIGNIVQAWDIDAVQLGGGTEKFRLAPTLAAGPSVQLYQFYSDVLALSQAHQINEIGDGFCIVHSRSAGDHKRGQSVTLGTAQGDAGQIQHIEDRGEGHFITDRKGHDIKIRNGIAGLQREKQNARFAHFLLHITPRGKDTLAPYAVHVVHDAIKDPHTKV